MQTSRPLTIAVVATAALLVGCSSSASSGRVDPNDQDPACHRAALARAASEAGFQWNVSGMELYHSEYEDCLRVTELLGS